MSDAQPPHAPPTIPYGDVVTRRGAVAYRDGDTFHVRLPACSGLRVGFRRAVVGIILGGVLATMSFVRAFPRAIRFSAFLLLWGLTLAAILLTAIFQQRDRPAVEIELTADELKIRTRFNGSYATKVPRHAIVELRANTWGSGLVIRASGYGRITGPLHREDVRVVQWVASELRRELGLGEGIRTERQTPTRL